MESVLCSSESWCAQSFVSPSPVEVLWSNPTSLGGQILWGFPGALLGPQAGKPDVGIWTFTRVGELLWYYCSPVCGSLTWQVWDFILSWLCPSYHLSAASSLFLDVGYLFFGRFQCPPVDGCSIDSCDFAVFTGGNEHTFFYSTILKQEPTTFFLTIEHKQVTGRS